jgi:hypothetical protein
VEPDSFAFGSTIATAVQTGRFDNGGASNINWATSTDAGATWTAGSLPGPTNNGSGRRWLVRPGERPGRRL